jgi:hypothetical protein
LLLAFGSGLEAAGLVVAGLDATGFLVGAAFLAGAGLDATGFLVGAFFTGAGLALGLATVFLAGLATAFFFTTGFGAEVDFFVVVAFLAGAAFFDAILEAGLVAVFLAGLATTFLTGAFLAATFFAGAAFFAGAFFAGAAFLVGAFFAGAAFLVGAFFAGAAFFTGADFLTALAGAFFAEGFPVGFFALAMTLPSFRAIAPNFARRVGVKRRGCNRARQKHRFSGPRTAFHPSIASLLHQASHHSDSALLLERLVPSPLYPPPQPKGHHENFTFNYGPRSRAGSIQFGCLCSSRRGSDIRIAHLNRLLA